MPNRDGLVFSTIDLKGNTRVEGWKGIMYLCFLYIDMLFLKALQNIWLYFIYQ